MLGDDLGLGKTITALGRPGRRQGLPALVVTLPTSCVQWGQEVHRALPRRPCTSADQIQPWA